MNIPPPKTSAERDLERLTSQVAQGDVARARRGKLAHQLWVNGMTHAELAARMDRADKRGGGTGVSLSQAQKIVQRAKPK